MKNYIYILQDPITNEVRYVGKSKNPHRRYLSHLWQKPKVKYHSYYWIQKLLKNGLNPILTVIDETEEDWIWLEQYWIEQFKQWGFNLTNITSGGEGACKSANWNNVPVTAFTKEGQLIKTFESQKECAQYFNTSSNNVTRVVNGNTTLLLKKYQIKIGKLENDINNFVSNRTYNWKNKPTIYWTSKKIICLEDNKEFNSITEASKHYNISMSSMTNNLQNKSKKLKNGKTFKYI